MYRTILSVTFLGVTGFGGMYHDATMHVSGALDRVTRAAFPCSQTITYSVGATDTPVKQGRIIAALSDVTAAWDKAAGRVLFAYTREGGDISIDLQEHDPNPLVYVVSGADPSYESSLFEEQIRISGTTDEQLIRHLLAHELGHAAGLADSLDRDSVMNLQGTSTIPSEVDARTLRELCGVRPVIQ